MLSVVPYYKGLLALSTLMRPKLVNSTPNCLKTPLAIDIFCHFNKEWVLLWWFNRKIYSN